MILLVFQYRLTLCLFFCVAESEFLNSTNNFSNATGPNFEKQKNFTLLFWIFAFNRKG